MDFIKVLTLVVVLILLANFMQCSSCAKEPFYDWQTLGTTDHRFPHYRNEHPIFFDTEHVGCGSCIYNKLDPNFDGVLPDWQYTLQKYGNTIWKSPPLED